MSMSHTYLQHARWQSKKVSEYDQKRNRLKDLGDTYSKFSFGGYIGGYIWSEI